MIDCLHPNSAAGRRWWPAAESLPLLMVLVLWRFAAAQADEVDDLMRTVMHREQIPGMALLVMRAGKVTHVLDLWIVKCGACHSGPAYLPVSVGIAR